MVEVCIPAAQQCYYALLPTAFTLGQIKKHILVMIQDCSNGAFIMQKENVMFHVRLQCYLAEDTLLKDMDIQNADELIIW